jgi:hypothetical protein
MLSLAQSLQTERKRKRKREERERNRVVQRCLFPINNSPRKIPHTYIYVSTKCVQRANEWLTVRLSEKTREIFLRTSR